MLGQFQPQLKILWHWEKIDQWLRTGDTTPVMFELDPSEVCNHDCIWCTFDYFRHSVTGRPRELTVMPRDLLLRVVGEISDLGTRAINWTGGGEPLTNPATGQALRLAASLGLENGLYTNGQALTEEICETIVDTCTWCRITLDAATPETHAAVHRVRPEVFGKVTGMMRRLDRLRRERGSDVVLGSGMLVHPLNYREIPDIARLIRDVGFDYCQFKPVVMNDLREKQIDPGFFRDKAVPLLEEAAALSETTCRRCGHRQETDRAESTRCPLCNRPLFKVLVTSYKFNDIMDRSYGRAYEACLSHPFMGTIGGDGEVYLCCHHRGHAEFSFGNLKERPLAEIWNSPERQEVIGRVDVNRCHVLCKNQEINKFLWHLRNPDPALHPNFL